MPAKPHVRRTAHAPRLRVAVLPRLLRRPRGASARAASQTNAVRGLLDMIASLVERRRPTHLVACWDNDWRPAFRVEAIPSYKAHRVAEAGRQGRARREAGPGRPRGAGPDHRRRPRGARHRPRRLRRLRGRRRHRHAGDRISAAVCRSTSSPGDRDLFQLVDDANQVRVLYTARGGVRSPDLVDEAFLAREVRRAAPATPTPTWRCCAATPATACPGVAGIGEKTAAKLITTLRHPRRPPRRRSTAGTRPSRAPSAPVSRPPSAYLDVAPLVVARRPATRRARGRPRAPDGGRRPDA